MSVKFYNGYWTIFSGDQPVMSCASFEAAMAYMDETEIDLAVARLNKLMTNYRWKKEMEGYNVNLNAPRR